MRKRDRVRHAKTVAGDQGLTFQPVGPFNAERLVSALRNTYTVQAEAPQHLPLTYYDTYDWRLFNKSLALMCTPTHACLQSLGDESLLVQAKITAAPVFRQDLPEGELQTRLSPILSIRALRPLCTISTHSQTLRILDRNAKTVVRLVVDQHHLRHDDASRPLLTRVCIKPIRGYDKAAMKLRNWLTRHDFAPLPGSLYPTALAAAGRVPNDYSAKLRLHFDPQARADAATQEILRFLCQVMRQNEAGIIEDVDTECLHDFRVAIRRTRSALGQIKSVFSARLTARFKRDFAYLGSITNPLRDLDVYLLRQDRYQARLPEHLRADIEPLFASLQRQRAKAHTTLVRHLRSKKYATIMTDWEAFLTSLPEPAASAAQAARPILSVARKRIRKKCRAVVKLGTQLQLIDHPDDKSLHQLRIECKKLRYLLEFFSSLFVADDIAPLIKSLRRLQDNLGDFHDACVQQEALHTLANDWLSTTPESRRTLRAIDSLIGCLEGDKQTLGEAFSGLFSNFAASISEAPF
jgi:CHAD domain-containing protein